MTLQPMRRAFVVVTLLLAAGAAAALAQDEQVFKPGNGVTLPHAIHEQKPQYTREAMAAGIQGTVMMSLVVRSDGTVGPVEVTRSLDKTYGLDESAVAAARQWRFEPGRKDGKPVAVEVTLELTFTLRDKKK
jgi:TonB family protein